MQEWAYYLNAGSKVYVSYDVKYPDSSTLFLVIAQGTGNILQRSYVDVYYNLKLMFPTMIALQRSRRLLSDI